MWVESSIPGEIFSGKRFVLASNSPQRIKLLKLAGLSFDVVPHGVDESFYNKRLPPDVLVQFLASLKACSVAKGLKDVFIIGADT
ncbi:MAG: Maf family protein, partial [Candidatus Kuenenia sp.]|nr:Maf family protein [Candidatus Kuenenia sp.]